MEEQSEQQVSRRGFVPPGLPVTLIYFLVEDEAEVITWAEEHTAVYTINGRQGSPIWELVCLPTPDKLPPFPIRYITGEGGTIEKTRYM